MTISDDDLEDLLRNLQGPVESSDATEALNRFRTQREHLGKRVRTRQILLTVGAMATLLFVGGAVAMTLGENGDEQVVTAGLPNRGASDPSPVSISVHVRPESLVVGERLYADVVVANEGSEDLVWDRGGCGYNSLTTQLLTRDEASSPTSSSDGDVWDGNLSGLTEWVLTHPSTLRPDTTMMVEPRLVGIRSLPCIANRDLRVLSPGQALTRELAVDLPAAAGPVPTYQVRVDFIARRGTTNSPSGPPITSSQSFPVENVTDDPERANPEPALEAVEQSEVVETWLAGAAGDIPGTPGFEVDFSWHRHAWEVWLTGGAGASRETLRTRYDPTLSRIIDIRQVNVDAPPSDDVDGQSATSNELVLYHEG